MTAYEEVVHEVEATVRSTLRSELGSRGLLLPDDVVATAMAEQQRRGADLLGDLLAHCYGVSAGPGVSVQFGDEADAARVELALSFGALTGRLIAGPSTDPGPAPGPYPSPGPAVEGATDLLCATFNLGIGLIDGLCDRAPTIGLALLDAVAGAELRSAAREGWPAGQLVTRLPEALRAEPASLFAARVVESVFELLQLTHPGGSGLATREEVGSLLLQALEAEQRSVAPRQGVVPKSGAGDLTWSPLPGGGTDRRELRECSRRTSVLPFRIIALLATGDPEPAERTPGGLLGEAMWRLDDLVDLVPDLEQGALNAVLLGARPAYGQGPDPTGLLRRLRESDAVAAVAGRAATLLRDGLDRSPGTEADRRSFLAFVQTYAGLGSGADATPQP